MEEYDEEDDEWFIDYVMNRRKPREVVDLFSYLYIPREK
jgi:hypothetical protein